MEPRKVLRVLVDTFKKTVDAGVVNKAARLTVVVQCKDMKIRFLEMTSIIRLVDSGPYHERTPPTWEAEMKFPRVCKIPKS